MNEMNKTAFHTKESKFELCRSKAEPATSRSQRLPTIFNFFERAGKKTSFFFKLKVLGGALNRDLRLSKQAALTTAPPPPPALNPFKPVIFIHYKSGIARAIRGLLRIRLIEN